MLLIVLCIVQVPGSVCLVVSLMFSFALVGCTVLLFGLV